MHRTAWIFAAALALGPAQAQEPPATLLTAARIHTMDAARPLARAMAYDADGRILAVGDPATLAARFPQARRIDVGDATVVPGLIDAHAHVSGLGMAMMEADLTGATDKQEVLRRLQAHARTLAPGAWLVGRGWDQNDWPERAFPTAAELDAVFPDRPV